MSKSQIDDRCSTCRFWLDKRPFSDGSWGVCGRTSHDGKKPLVGPDSVGATVGGREGGSRAPGRLHTRQDYGCTLYSRMIDCCLECETVLSNNYWNYCPNCGRKIKDD